MKKFVVMCMIAAFIFTGCATQTKTGAGAGYGAAAGAAAGALAGQLIGKDTEATLLGAAVGAALGGATGAGIGKAMDEQEKALQDALRTSEAAAVQREGNILAVVLKGDVSFDTGSATVRPGLYSEINRIAQIMVQYPQTRIIVEGHTDSRGSEASNQRLSERRARSVGDLLIQQGVNSSRITTIGYGESQPVASNNSSAGRQQNRRVAIKIDGGQAS